MRLSLPLQRRKTWRISSIWLHWIEHLVSEWFLPSFGYHLGKEVILNKTILWQILIIKQYSQLYTNGQVSIIQVCHTNYPNQKPSVETQVKIWFSDRKVSSSLFTKTLKQNLWSLGATGSSPWPQYDARVSLGTSDEREVCLVCRVCISK